MSSAQITTVTFFEVDGWKNRFKAFQNMVLWPIKLKGVPGLGFSRLMGVGSGNGFSVIPDLGRYAWLAVWESEADATAFFSSHKAWVAYKKITSDTRMFTLKNTMSHGNWGGKNPFQASEVYRPDYPVAVLTRATIRWKDMLRFWKDVPAVSKSLHLANPPLLAVGIGEMPFRYQATFSIWKNGHDMMAYAYQHASHRKMVEKTRKTGWYKEELFARFEVVT